MSTADDTRTWGREVRQLTLVARNVSTRYLAIAVDGAIGLLLLPFNVSHLGQSTYGLWMLIASITLYFSVLDLGYGGAMVKFIAQYRAWRDRRALNEILSTMFVVFTVMGLVTLGVTGVVATQLEHVFNITAGQVETGRQLLLIIGGYIAVRFAASIFGAVVYGFQRFYLNNAISIATSVVAAVVNVLVLRAGYDLVPLVLATTLVRVVSLGGFVWTAYRVFPGLHVNPRLFRRERLKEVTGFSVYMLVLDWSAKLNYTADALVIGAMVSTAAVAVWTVAQRLAEVSQQLTNQLADALFPVVVDSDAAQRGDRLRMVLVQGTRLSLALAVPVCAGLAFMAESVVAAWVGDTFSDSVTIAQVLLLVVVARVATGTSNALLKGAGSHRLLAITNATTAVINVLLSIMLIRPFGLVGVAVATLAPVSCAAAFVIFPAACHRVGLSVGEALRQAVWPPVWPVAALLLVLWAGRTFADGLPGIAALLVAAGVTYQALFFGVAVNTTDRRFYWRNLSEFVMRRRRAPAAA